MRALKQRLGASMLLVVGGRPKTAGSTVLRLMLVDRSTLCRRHDMRVRVCNWITARYRVACVLVGWWVTMAPRGVKRDVCHVSVGCKVYMCVRGCEV